MEELPNIEPFRKRYDEIEKQLSEPDVFKDAQRASTLNREHTRIRRIIEIFDNAKHCREEILSTQELLDDPELSESAHEEITFLEQKQSELKSSLLVAMLPEEEDTGKNTIVEIRAGAGG